ncbi:hypothetical protein WMY93_029415 [Mugilogobius chulae]|uniref:non-specific serine/threonine protein kinase n=1 Tax=Mugilogobius chulae TaxID=88201 RepID=A0AAW0N2W9_9GOBI
MGVDLIVAVFAKPVLYDVTMKGVQRQNKKRTLPEGGQVRKLGFWSVQTRFAVSATFNAFSAQSKAMALQKSYTSDGLRVRLQGAVTSLFDDGLRGRRRTANDCATWTELRRSALAGQSRKRKASDVEFRGDEAKKPRLEPVAQSELLRTRSAKATDSSNSVGEDGERGRKRKSSRSPSRRETKKSRRELSAELTAEVQLEVETEEERRDRESEVKRTEALKRLAKPGDEADFKSKYLQQEELGEGGFGSVFAGVRISDQEPVAIKHIRRKMVQFTSLSPHLTEGQRGEEVEVPSEALYMVKAQDIGQGSSVQLLEWFNLEDEVILVMERPTPSEDLFNFCFRNSPLTESDAKVMTKQLVDSMVDLHANGVFHRDIKLENLLVQSTKSGPRLRIIDFGLSCEDQPEPYQTYKGTRCLAPPEYFLEKTYSAGPTSVWQVGTVLYEMLRSKEQKQFLTPFFLRGQIHAPVGVSKECTNFLQACFTKDPQERLSLDQMSHHPWFSS